MESRPRRRESRVNPGANESSSAVDAVLLGGGGASATGSLVLIDEATAATVESHKLRFRPH